MSKPDLTVIEGGKVELIKAPAEVKFPCWKCGAGCRMFPSQKPMSVQHSMPVCVAWLQVVAKEDDIERFLIKCGVELLLPQADG